MKLITPPEPIDISLGEKAIFLAGSIANDTAARWQDLFIERLKGFDVTILNPRRANWEPTWVQSIDNPLFKKQVDWELKGLESVDKKYFYFDPNTESPITLLELGFQAGQWDTLSSMGALSECDIVVCCPYGYWRKGNVDILCRRYDIPMVDTLSDLIDDAVDWLS